MKTLVCKEPGKLLMETTELLEPKADEVALQINYVGICGTDIHAFNGRQPFFTYPRVLGHEISAEVYSVGSNIPTDIIGKACTIIPYISCGTCHSCKKGKPNACEKISVVGVHQDGAYTEYLTVPFKQVIFVENMKQEHISLIEPFSIGHHAISRANLQEDSHVAVVGGGPIGITIAYIAKLKNMRVSLIEIDVSKHAFLKEITKCDAIYSSGEDMQQKVDVIFDATGNKNSMESTVQQISHGGTIVYVGLIQDHIKFFDPEFHAKEVSILGSRNALVEDFNAVIEILKNESLADAYISDLISLEDAESYFLNRKFINKTLIKIS